MNCQELETAVRLRTPFVNMIWENRQFGSIVWKQDKKFGRHFGVDFTNPDFVKLAEAFGMPAWRCESVDDFGAPPAPRADARRPLAHRRAHRLLHRRRHLGGAGNGDRCHMTTTTPNTSESAVVERVPKQLYIGGEWRDGAEAPRCPSRIPPPARRSARSPTARRRTPSPPWRPRSPPRRNGARTRPASAARSCAAPSRRSIERADELALLMTLEMGKPLKESKAEITYAAEFFRWFAEQSVRIDGRYAVAPNGQGRLLTMKQPVGPSSSSRPGTSRWPWARARSGPRSPPAARG